MPKPLIGLTSTKIRNPSRLPASSVNEAYINSIMNAGGLPVLIPRKLSNDDLDELAERMDGILFTGGDDIDPRRYGNPAHPKVKGIDADRDRSEIHLVQVFVKSGKPFFGICRGCQVINVALGGSLYEDLPEQFHGMINHDNHDHPRDYMAHSIEVRADSRLAKILISRTILVNSLHHQGIQRLAQELYATAIAPDGLVEEFELSNHTFGLAVQWHPEELQEDESMRDLFKLFIQACQTKKSNPKDLERS